LTYLVLCGLDVAIDVDHGGVEVLGAGVQLVVSVEAAGQSRAADQREEGEAAADRPRLPLLVVLCVTAPLEWVEE
jgi:hypothetical protein